MNNDLHIEDMLTGRMDEWMLDKQEKNQKPKFLSASLKHADAKQRAKCTLCGDFRGSHWAGTCPLSNSALVYSGSE